MNAVTPEPLIRTLLVQDDHGIDAGHSGARAQGLPNGTLTAKAPPNTVFAKTITILGVPAYNPRWETLQRTYQNNYVAAYLVQTGWSSVLVMGVIGFAVGVGDLTWLVRLALLTNVFFLAIGLCCMPGSRFCKVQYNNPRSGTVVTFISLLGIAVGWSIFVYTTIVFLPDEWQGISVGAGVAVIAMGGIGCSPHPLLALGFMGIVASGGILASLVPDKTNSLYYISAWIYLVLLLYAQFLRRSRDALQHVSDAAELEASEAEKRLAIETAHEAERGLLEAREQERNREEERRVHKDQTRRKELFDLAARFEANIGEVSGIVAAAASRLSATAKDVSREASSATAQIADIATAIDQVAHGSTAAAAASDEFAVSIDNVSEQAETAAQLARFTNQTATATDASVADLMNRAEGIGDIANLIDSIAGRTRLLAINASIEAVRGGEAGRGFAVVAAEVKDLAIQTSRATRDVSSNIEDMQLRTQASAQELADMRKQIGAVETSAANIAAAMNQQSQASRSLAQSIDLAATGAADVSATTQGLRSTAASVGQVSAELMTASNHLETQADLLKHKVADFLEQIRRAQD
ncbi:MAG: methyl-accepting chemotaxis protein [Erythrobacter sp.]|uniref:methyl-accepting chemotaxis protein n=1 Tax=Erythrobacter sp. TaxID=1042 RepID=UPI003299DAE4